MNLAAIQHGSTGSDCLCLAPGRFLFRLRSARGDLARVVLHTQDKYMPLQYRDSRQAIPMRLTVTDNTLDYWETELTMDVICLRYWFEMTDTRGETVYFANYQFSGEGFSDVNTMFDCPQCLREEDRFLLPAWAENKVVYQIFPSRFASSQKVPARTWYKAPITARDDLHGDLRGIIDHLPHLTELGVDVLYMTPVFRSDSCHKYDTIDYYTIDPSFGTKEDLKELVDKAHTLGLRVVMDAVFNHTSPEFFAFADVKRNGPASPYLDWYYVDGFPLHARRGEKPNFKTFAYYGGMPKLNLRNPQTVRYVTEVALYWLRECHIDGWRLDVGDEIGHRFWKRFREDIKAEFPEALIIGEVWHHAGDFLQGDEWDTVMNYHFYQQVLGLIWGNIPVSRFVGGLNFLRGQLHPEVTPRLWNLIGSHDTPRILAHCGGDKRRMKLAAALQLLYPGMPMIYYGDEYAMDGGQDPDCRRGMVWDKKRQDGDMFRWYQRLLRLRRERPELLRRDYTEETDDDRALLIRRCAGCSVVFCCSERGIALPEFMGRTDLISGERFAGEADGFSVLVFAEE